MYPSALLKKTTQILKYIVFTTLGIFIVWVLAVQFIANDSIARLPVKKTRLPSQYQPQPHSGTPSELSILTLNMAHGRNNSFHQLFLSKSDIENNLKKISDRIKRINPDIVALQEVDNASFWSGNFNHIDYLAQQIPMGFSVQGEHVKGIGLAYGTAILSNLVITKGASLSFQPSILTPAKGVVLATINPNHPDHHITFVSVHFDFLSQSLRTQQAENLAEFIKKSPHPLIIAGDMNSTWENQQSVVKQLCEKLNLHVYHPLSEKTPTFPFTGKRIDWILVSKSLTFTHYGVIEQTLSDHKAVLIKVRWQKDPS